MPTETVPPRQEIATECVVIGGGVIGLAVAAELAAHRPTVLLETHDGFGRETSSRNSEVIHSGIHYPAQSLKTRLCVEGQKALYAFARRHNVPFQECGKLVIAKDAAEKARLEQIAAHVREVGVRFEFLDAAQVQAVEPNLSVHAALRFPETGIIDSHSFMAALEGLFSGRGGLAGYQHRVGSIRKQGSLWELDVESPDGPLSVRSPWVINTAGLHAALLSNQALATSRYEHRFCRGRYFHLSAKFRAYYRHLVYPLPQQHGLGVHTTLDMEGFLRLGPDVDWCPDSDPAKIASYYQCDWDGLRREFLTAARKLLPDVAENDLTPGTVGIRPKLFIDGTASPDFLVENHAGWVHCLGMESPGLTSALAVAKMVAGFVKS